MGNEIIGSTSFRIECRHGRTSGSCNACRKILDIVSKDPDRRLGLRAQAQDRRSSRGGRRVTSPSRGEISQDKAAFNEWRQGSRIEPEAGEDARDRPPTLRAAFAADAWIQLAFQRGALTHRQAALLRAWADTEDAISFRELGRRAGCSHHTAQAELARIYRGIVASGEKEFVGVKSLFRLMIVRARGRRGLQAYVRHSVHLRIGNEIRKESWLERINHRPVVRRLLREGHFAADGEFVPLRVSPVRQLLTALALAPTSKLKGDPRLGLTVSPSDWTHNLAWARKRLQKGSPQAERSLIEVVLALTNNCRLCLACHTPILGGCRLQGKRIAKDRRFCDAACKMAHGRR